MHNSHQEYLIFANKLADAASIISMQYFRNTIDIDNKSDEITFSKLLIIFKTNFALLLPFLIFKSISKNHT